MPDPTTTKPSIQDIILEIVGIAAGVGAAYTVGTPQAILKAAGALEQIVYKALQAHSQVIGTLIDENLIQPVPLDPGAPGVDAQPTNPSA